MAMLPIISTTREMSIVGGATLSSWPAADRIIYCPIRIREDCTVKRVFWANGSSVSGNLNLGLYDSAGTKLWETGSTAQSGANQAQFVDIADQSVDAGLYYIALQCSATPSIPRMTGSLWEILGLGVLQENAGSFALPATATFAKLANAYLPAFGLDLRGAP